MILAPLRRLIERALPKRQPPHCPHPEDSRVTFSAMGVVHWKCRDCGYEFLRRKDGG